MIYYVAGAYSPNFAGGVEDNIRAAERVAVAIWREGHVALCPHLNTARWDEKYPDIPYQTYIEGYLAIVPLVDAITMVPGLQNSQGAVRERTLAIQLGKIVRYAPLGTKDIAVPIAAWDSITAIPF